MDNFYFFDISFKTLNLFSFMLGMTFAFFEQGRAITPLNEVSA